MSINKQIFINCMNAAPVGSAQTGGAAAATDNTVNHFMAGPWALEVRNEQTNSDIVPTRVVDADSTNGWQLPNDNADNDGAEMGFGILNDTNAAHAFTIGTDPAFFFEIKMGIPDVSDYDVLGMGFRIQGAYVDAVNTPAAYLAAYTDKAGFNVNAGSILTVTSLNGSDTSTDTTDDWADDGVHILRVNVSAAGVATFQHDVASAGTRAAPTTVGTHTFDTGDVVVPYIIWCKGGNDADTPPIIEYIACGYQ